MDARLQLRVQRYGWDKASAYYDEYWAAQLAIVQERLIERAALSSGEGVIDVACGTGLVTFPAATAVTASGRVLATDVSSEMVARAEADARAHGLLHVTFARMNAQSLECADGVFDAALCSLGLMYVPDPQAAVGEMFRVLKPKGRAVLSVWGARNRCGWAEIFSIVDRRVASEVCPLFFQLGTGATLARACSEAGFTDVTEERIATRMVYESAKAACGAAFVGGPVALAYSRFDERTREEAQQEYLDSIASYRRLDSYEVPAEFVVVHATKPRA